MNNTKILLAEFIGTFWLVLGGCGAAVISNGDASTFGLVGVALAFGLCIMSMAYAVGPISGGHFNPAVSVGMWMAGRIEGSKLSGYILAQLLGAIAGAGMLYTIASGNGALDMSGGLASNGFGDLSPGGYSMEAAIFCEVVSTFLFVIVILGVTEGRSNPGMAGLVIGLTLAGIIMATGPVANASLNPARSTGPAAITALLDGNGEYLRQVWLFWLAPIAGAAIAGMVHKKLLADK